MSTLTGFLSLIKAAGGESQDVDIINQNWDKIDNYLKASDNFIPLPLGASTSDSANFNTPFGYQAAYADMGDHYILRGVAGRVNTSLSLDSSHTIGRLPAALAAVQYFNAQGSGTAIVPLQINPTGTIVVKSTPTNASYWASLDSMRIWKS